MIYRLFKKMFPIFIANILIVIFYSALLLAVYVFIGYENVAFKYGK